MNEYKDVSEQSVERLVSEQSVERLSPTMNALVICLKFFNW